MLDSKLAQLAFVFIVLSLFFPWFTVSTSSDAEDYQYYYRTNTKEYYGISDVSITNKIEYETKYEKDSSITRVISEDATPVKKDEVSQETEDVPNDES